jgi:hypothetical protein
MLVRAATTLWATSQWSRRWASLVVIAVVLLLTGSLALGAAMGARRSVTAFDRLREQAFATDVIVTEVRDEQLDADPRTTLARLLPLIDAAD